MGFILAYIIGLLLLGAFLFWLALERFGKIQKAYHIELDALEIPTKAYSLIDVPETAEIDRKNLIFEKQSLSYQKQFRHIEHQFNQAKITDIYLIHGTFAGDDPFDLINYLSPVLPKQIVPLIQRILEVNKTIFLNDLGHFTPKYVRLLKQALPSIRVRRFIWPSGNNHLSRLKGLALLVRDLTSQHNNEKRRILLLGHSHAGQLFALLTWILKSSSRQAFIDQLPIVIQEEFQKLDFKALDKIDFNFVTLGTPLRYEWKKSSRYDALHIINHRGPIEADLDFKGLIKTKQGDYIQKIATAGSDLRPLTLDDYLLNKELDNLFGVGIDLELWTREIRKSNRVTPTGHTLLVDFKDDSKFPNFFRTLFGHGIYTRYQTMLPIFQLISEKISKT